MDYLSINRDSWNRRAEVHFVSQFYDVDGFLSGKTSLTEIELAELPNLSGKRLLHLQCHFGLDTLSLARMGALCTGVDFSSVGTYTENSGNLKSTLISWPHSLSTVINALIDAGLEIRCINEYPYSPYPCFEGIEEREPDRFYLSHLGQDVPLVFTIQCKKL